MRRRPSLVLRFAEGVDTELATMASQPPALPSGACRDATRETWAASSRLPHARRSGLHFVEITGESLRIHRRFIGTYSTGLSLREKKGVNLPGPDVTEVNQRHRTRDHDRDVIQGHPD